ncbi:hypothetical protein D2T81_09480, partial [Azospirillum brasilense]
MPLDRVKVSGKKTPFSAAKAGAAAGMAPARARARAPAAASRRPGRFPGGGAAGPLGRPGPSLGAQGGGTQKGALPPRDGAEVLVR